MNNNSGIVKINLVNFTFRARKSADLPVTTDPDRLLRE